MTDTREKCWCRTMEATKKSCATFPAVSEQYFTVHSVPKLERKISNVKKELLLPQATQEQNTHFTGQQYEPGENFLLNL